MIHLLFFSLASATIILQNCQIANLVTSTCLTCNSGYALVNNQCQWQQNGQLTITNQFWSNTVPQTYATNNAQSSQSVGVYGGTTGQIFVPGYVQPSQGTSQNQISSSSTASQAQNQYLIELLNYLSSQQNPQLFTSTSSQTSSSTLNFDPNCKTPQGSVCLECYKSYYFNRTQNKCLSINPQCKTSTDGLCTACYEGYLIQSGNCVVDRSYKSPDGGDLNCKVKNSLGLIGCLECYPSFYFNSTQNKCVAVNPQCKQVTKTNQCTSCWPGYSLTSGNCFLESSSSLTSSTSSLTQGATSGSQTQGFVPFLDQYFSGQIPTSAAMTTTQRYGNYIAQFDLTGKLLRIYSASQQTSAVQQLQSQSTNSACTQFYNNICQGCIQGYFLSSNGCMPIDVNCLSWSSTNVCQKCQAPYQLSLLGCALSFTAPTPTTTPQQECFFRQVKINGVCTAVSNDCKEWDKTGQCTACYPGYTLSMGKCGV